MPSQERSRPQFSPSPRELDDVDVLRIGALAPQSGFDGPDEDVTLVTPRELAAAAREFGELEIIDPEGVPLAVVTIEDTYERADGTTAIIGPVRPLPGRVRRAFGDLYLPPSSSRATLSPDTLTVPVVGALSQVDIAVIAEWSGETPPLFLVLCGEGSPLGLSRHGLIRATKVAASHFPGSTVIAVPVAARPDPGADQAFRERIVEAYAPGDRIYWPTGGGSYPADVAEVVAVDRPSGFDRGLVVFFTGLSGSGKSTISQSLRDRVLECGERTVSLLDGDRVRRNLSLGLSFSRQDRETNVERIGWVAAEIARHGALAICSPIAPFDRTRKKARAMVTETGAAFVLVHVATPLAECEARDRKGLYAKARRGEIPEFTGISSPYEVPEDAEIVIDTTDRSIQSVLDEVLSFLVTGGWLRPSVLDSSPAHVGTPS